MLKNTLIIALVIVIIYLYYQQKKSKFLTGTNEIVSKGKEFAENLGKNIESIRTFLKEQLNSDSLEEAQEKLGSKTLDEILEDLVSAKQENSDWETEVDTLTRTKESLEADLTSQAQAFQARLREKDREIKKLKEELGSEKQQHKGSLGRIKLLTEQIQNLEQEIKDSAEQKRKLEEKIKKMPGEFPEADETYIPAPTQEKALDLEAFIQWVADYEEFKKVDWNYYRSQPHWEKAFRNWNKLRADRINLLEKWKETKSNQRSKNETNH